MKPRYIIICDDPQANGVRVWADSLETARRQHAMIQRITGRLWRIMERRADT